MVYGIWEIGIRELLAASVRVVRALCLPLGFHWVSIGFALGFAAAGAAAADGIWYMGYGTWDMGYGTRYMLYAICYMLYTICFMVYGIW